jgi:hypothetical protein
MRRALAGAAAACLALTGAGAAAAQAAGLPQGSEPVTLDPKAFTTDIDNPFLPLSPGSRWVYRERVAGGPEQRVVVTVTSRVRTVAGIRARVIRDVVTAAGKVVEDTYDWYAQDRAGNVWYLGEDTKEYRDGKVVSRAGSWEAGVRGAQAGIAMPATPVPGLSYRQEYLKGEAEDIARVLSTDEQVQAPRGLFRGALLTKDLTPLKPSLVEYKIYARGVGLVLAVAVSGGSDREELLSYRRGRAG